MPLYIHAFKNVQKHEIYIIHSYVLSIILFMKLKVFTKTVSQIAFISSKFLFKNNYSDSIKINFAKIEINNELRYCIFWR